MKKILTIICLPFILLGQITIYEPVKNKSTKTKSTLDFSFIYEIECTSSIKSGIGFYKVPSDYYAYWIDYPRTRSGIYVIPNAKFDLRKIKKINIFGTISAPINYFFVKEGTTITSYMEEFEYRLNPKVLARIQLNVGAEYVILKNLSSRFSFILPILGREKAFNSDSDLGYPSSAPNLWGAGVDLELEYSVTNEVAAFFNASRKSINNPIDGVSLVERKKWYTEMYIGINYKL